MLYSLICFTLFHLLLQRRTPQRDWWWMTETKQYLRGIAHTVLVKFCSVWLRNTNIRGYTLCVAKSIYLTPKLCVGVFTQLLFYTDLLYGYTANFLNKPGHALRTVRWCKAAVLWEFYKWQVNAFNCCYMHVETCTVNVHVHYSYMYMYLVKAV